MKQVKFFKPEEYEQVNEFLKTSRPIGQNGLSFNQSGFFIIHEVGDPLDATEQIKTLNFEIGQHLERIMHSEKEIRFSQKRIEIYQKEISELETIKPTVPKEKYEQKKYIEERKKLIEAEEGTIIAKQNMNKLEKACIDAIKEMISEIK